jgi:hypothetical protein
MNINRLIIKGKQEGQNIFLIGFEGEPEQGFVANLEHGLRWYRTVYIPYLAIVTAGNLTTVPEIGKSLSEWLD